ncbi:cyclase family protein [Serratia marcescens]|uniref:cyclase family protein n=1 Tax=Serratia marcescens TaxID=615 RepID=UPI003D168055
MSELKRIIDLSVSIDPDFWEPEPVTRKVVNHQDGADKLGKSYSYFQAMSFWRRCWMKIVKSARYHIDHRDFPDGMGLSLMTYSLTTHTGTHIDAPYHYGWRSGKEGEQKTVTDIPLSWCYGRGVLLDFSDRYVVIDAVLVQQKLVSIGHELAAGDIVLINTGAYKNLGKREYFTTYQAIDTSALAWLIERGIRVIGTDAFSFDRPFCDMIADYKLSGNKEVLWPAHFWGRDHEYLQIERLGNLEELPSTSGFQVCCFPIKLEKADAAWSRVVAIID